MDGPYPHDVSTIPPENELLLLVAVCCPVVIRGDSELAGVPILARISSMSESESTARSISTSLIPDSSNIARFNFRFSESSFFASFWRCIFA